eukprot:30941-Pelagococcus_subviridis.AAC.8
MPNDFAIFWKYVKSWFGSTAAMSRIASAPYLRARSGHSTPADRMSSKFSNPPWKYFSSVSTERHAAPPASYAFAIFTGSKLG